MAGTACICWRACSGLVRGGSGAGGGCGVSFVGALGPWTGVASRSWTFRVCGRGWRLVRGRSGSVDGGGVSFVEVQGLWTGVASRSWRFRGRGWLRRLVRGRSGAGGGGGVSFVGGGCPWPDDEPASRPPSGVQASAGRPARRPFTSGGRRHDPVTPGAAGAGCGCGMYAGAERAPDRGIGASARRMQKSPESGALRAFSRMGVWRCPTFTRRMPHYHRR